MSDPDGTHRSLDGLETPPADAAPRRWPLIVLACAETATLAVLLLNLGLIGHSPQLARALGPVHGCLYAAGIVLTLISPLPRIVKAVAVVPILGIWAAVIASLLPTSGTQRVRP